MRLHTRPSGSHLLGLGGLGAVVLVIGIVVSITGASWRTQPSTSSAAVQATPGGLPPTFFGMNSLWSPGGAWPRVSVGAVRLWDTVTAWRDVNPAPGTWSWQRLDTAVATAGARRAPVLLVLGQTPTWAASRPTEHAYYGPGTASMPRDLENWGRYVRAVAERYRGRIEAYEVWNEVNLPGFFSGTPEQMVELTRAARDSIKAADPNALVVAPSVVDRRGNAVSWMQRFLAAGGGALADVISVHLYPAEMAGPEQKPLLQAVRGLLRTRGIAKPIWDTETNYQFKGRVLDDTTAAAFVARTYLWSASQGLPRVYWYAWEVQQPAVAVLLTRADGATPTPAAQAFTTVRRWIGGWRPTGCTVDTVGTWTCRFVNGGQQRATIWNPSRRSSIATPTWGRARSRLGASSIPLTRGQSVSVDGTPILITS